jgi:hypothetical protein
MKPPLHDGFPVAACSRLKIRAAAQHARKVLCLPAGRINIARLLDDLTRFGIYYDVFDRASAPVPREVEACYVPEDRTLYIRDTVYSEMVSGGMRAVFTLGHELGHAVLAHRRTFNRQSIIGVPIYSQSEWQANRFSAEFTMPLNEISQFNLFTAEQIANFFGVSPAAARVRLSDLEKYKELKKKP